MLVQWPTVEHGNAVVAPTPLFRYQFGNHAGSASVELDENGALLAYEEYHPYGTTAFQAGRSIAEVSLRRYRYTGRERDVETGLSLHLARLYVPWLARWLSSDPVGLQDGVNTYQYARLNPMTRTDQSGTQSDPIVFGEPQQFGTQATRPGYTREHVGATAIINVPLDDRFEGKVHPDDLARMKGAIRRETETVLLRNDGAAEKTHARGDALTQGDNARTRAAKTPGYDNRTEFLVLERRLKELNRKHGGGNAELQRLLRGARSSYAKGIKGEAILAEYAERGERLPKTVAPLLRAPAPKAAPVAPKPSPVSPGAGVAPAAAPAKQPSLPSTQPVASTGLQKSAGAASGTLVRSVAPGVAEAEATLVGAAYYASGSAATAPLVAPLLTAAEAVPVVGGGVLAGGFAGNAYEEAAVSLGASEPVATGAGVGGAILSGAAVGALIGSPTGIGAPVGAVIGGAAGLIGYGLSKWL